MLGVKLIPKWNLVNIYVIHDDVPKLLLLIQSYARDTQFKIYVYFHRWAYASTIYLNNEEWSKILRKFYCNNKNSFKVGKMAKMALSANVFWKKEFIGFV